MITVEQAEQLIAERIETVGTERVSVAAAAGRVLRETVRADRDQPPFDRAMMDGIAVRAGDGLRRFTAVGETAAGAVAGRLGAEGECLHIMTGAPMPDGGDCVVPVERLLTDGDAIALDDEAVVEPGRFVHPQGSDHRQDDTLLAPGVRLAASHVAVAVSAGRAELEVSRLPAIAVCATGDELVDAGEPIEPHQIRRSNDYAMAALLADWGFVHCTRFHVRDGVAEQTQRFGEALEEHEVLVLAGGVSMGRYDHVAEVLDRLGVERVFHRVTQKPGKPMWFGVAPGGKPVFALPGNPVSALVCLRRYVLPALNLSLALEAREREGFAVLSEAMDFAPALTRFVPARLTVDADGRSIATPQPTNTSGDFGALARTDGFVALAREQQKFEAGHVAPWLAW